MLIRELTTKARRGIQRFWFRGAGLIFLLGLGLLAYAVWWEPTQLQVRHFAAPGRRWPADWKIAVVADPHFGPRDAARLEQVIATVNAAEPDVILLLGDYLAGGRFQDALPMETVAEGFGRLRSRYGVIAVLGNHDWWCGGEVVAAALRRHGVTVLNNAAVTVGGVNFAGIDFSGWDALECPPPDVVKALAQTDPALPTILLSHSPDINPMLPAGAVDFTVAGHTHGGQVRLPFLGALVIPSRYGDHYSEGWVESDAVPIFISRGVGTSMLQLRFNCYPEVAMLHLTAADRSKSAEAFPAFR